MKAYTSSLDFFDTDPAYRFAAFRKLDLADARDAAGVPQRSPGSTFKPFVLATALEQGVPLSRRYDGPHQMLIPIPGQPAWDLHNFDDKKNYGRIDLIEATVNSVNTVYGQLVMDVGPANVATTATRMGIDNPAMTNDPSIAIGSQPATVEDMASAYGAFAADGVHHPEVFVTRVTDRSGRVLYEAHPVAKQVLPPDISRTVTGVLQQVVQRGTGIDARIGPTRGRQDRQCREQHRCVVRRLHARARGRGLGRRAAVDRDPDGPAADPHHRAGRHVPGQDLADLRVERAGRRPVVDLPRAQPVEHHHDPADPAPPRARSRPASTRSSASTRSRPPRHCNRTATR